jgi:putative GTP pyrophosphokinase
MLAMHPPPELSKNQIDRLGDRLRKGGISDEDLRLLDSYRRSFSGGYESVVGQIRDQLNLEPTGRPAKSTTSIIDKLQRESIRLSQVQDIAGCRLIVNDIATQDDIVNKLRSLFEKSAIVDRREHPSHGYRAVHTIVDSGGKLIEIQVRTQLQHLWAELSEKFSDIIDPAIKYGGGNPETLRSLSAASDQIRDVEIAESILHDILSTVAIERPSEDTNRKITQARGLIDARKRRAASLVALLDAITLERTHDDLSD